MTVRQLWVQASAYNAIDDRSLLAALLPPGNFGPIGSVVGLRAAADLMVTLTSATVGNVSRGAAYIESGGSIYLLTNDTALPIAIGPSDPTLSRIDIVVAQINDPEVSGSSTDPEIKVIVGIPNANPVQPATPAGALLLSTVRVNAGSTAPIVTRVATAAVPPIVMPTVANAGATLIKTTSQNLVQVNTWQGISFQSVSMQRGGATNNFNNVIAPKSGIYQISLLAEFGTVGAGGGISLNVTAPGGSPSTQRNDVKAVTNTIVAASGGQGRIWLGAQGFAYINVGEWIGMLSLGSTAAVIGLASGRLSAYLYSEGSSA
jgi:hypothetical protein